MALRGDCWGHVQLLWDSDHMEALCHLQPQREVVQAGAHNWGLPSSCAVGPARLQEAVLQERGVDAFCPESVFGHFQSFWKPPAHIKGQGLVGRLGCVPSAPDALLPDEGGLLRSWGRVGVSIWNCRDRGSSPAWPWARCGGRWSAGGSPDRGAVGLTRSSGRLCACGERWGTD